MGATESVDLFATKGIEYLLVIGYLIALVGVWWALRRPARATAVRPPRPASIGGIRLPADRRYHQGHAWAAPTGEGDAMRVGLDDFAARLLGPPDFLAVPPVGTRLRQGERGWDVVIGRRRIPMLAPVDGEVVAINDTVLRDPALATREPYGAGWLLSVHPDPSPRFDAQLLSGPTARAWMTDVVERARQAWSPDVGVTLADGGAPVAGFARVVGGKDWPALARAFLLTAETGGNPDDLDRG